jgi:hypothetical protein
MMSAMRTGGFHSHLFVPMAMRSVTFLSQKNALSHASIPLASK